VAVDALFRIDVKLIHLAVVGLVAGGVDAIDWAHLYARIVLHADARLRDHVGHGVVSLSDSLRGLACKRLSPCRLPPIGPGAQCARSVFRATTTRPVGSMSCFPCRASSRSPSAMPMEPCMRAPSRAACSCHAMVGPGVSSKRSKTSPRAIAGASLRGPGPITCAGSPRTHTTQS